MTDNRAIYDQFDKAFNRVSAYVILDKSGGEDKHRDDFGQPVTSRAEFVDALAKDRGEYWDTRLRNAGFTVIQAV